MIYQAIHDRFRSQIADPNSTLHPDYSELADADFGHFCRAMFFNWTPKSKALRLTNKGNLVMTKLYQCWSWPVDPDQIAFAFSGRMTLHLHKHLKVPYHLSQRRLSIYGSEPALELELTGGDLVAWVKMFS